jgi:KDO2-lipid IV(A) lauroyltransferase
VIQQNMDIAYPGDRPEDRRYRARLLAEHYEHFSRLFFEVLQLFGPMRSFVRRDAEVLGYEHLEAALAGGRGAIALSSHLGNWEVLAAAAAVHRGARPLLVTKKLKPAWLHWAIEAGRARCGVSGTYEPKTYRDVLAHLKSNGVVGVVLDQYAGAPVGVRVPLFGVPVGTHTVVALLAKRTGAPVHPAHAVRQADGKFRVGIGPAIEWISDPNPNREIALNTANYAAILEKAIRAQPDQWLWTHRRFKGDLGPVRPGEWEGRRPR